MNKKEHQREVREQKKAAAQAASERKAGMMKMIYMGLGVLVASAILISVLRGVVQPTPSVDEVVAADHVKGNPDAPLTIVEYSDFQCPACEVQYKSIKEVWAPIKSSVRFVYRHFPLTNIHPHALTAAYYSEAAAMQGKFWEMHDLMFENQNRWSGVKEIEPVFDGFVKQLGLDAEKFAIDLKSDAVKSKVASDMQSAKKAQASATPSLYLNGELMTGVREADALKAAIRAAKSGS
jgi:protein-disulfide isomerase